MGLVLLRPCCCTPEKRPNLSHGPIAATKERVSDSGKLIALLPQFHTLLLQFHVLLSQFETSLLQFLFLLIQILFKVLNISLLLLPIPRETPEHLGVDNA